MLVGMEGRMGMDRQWRAVDGREVGWMGCSVYGHDYECVVDGAWRAMINGRRYLVTFIIAYRFKLSRGSLRWKNENK